MKRSTMNIDKSKVMKRAWSIFRSGHSFYSLSFSASLSRAWEVEKADIAYQQEQEKIAKQEAWFKANESEIRNIIHHKTTSVSDFYQNYVFNGD